MSTIYNKYFERYVNLVTQDEYIQALEKNHKAFMSLTASISEEKSAYRYGEDKWSIKELTSHIIDSERVFAYRALRFARNDKTDLAGYDENHYGVFSNADERSFADLVHEFDVTRQSSIAMYKSFDSNMIERIGTANQMAIDVKSLAYLISGHCAHHINILKERYLD